MAPEIGRIGFVGLGQMGRDQVRELAKGPTPLTIYDVAPAAMEWFRGKATLAKSLPEVGKGADVVALCVKDDRQVEDCAALLLPAMETGAVMLVHSTVRPSTMIALGERAAARGVTVLDAALARTGPAKDGPFVLCMTGGDEAAAARVQSVLDTYSITTLHVGPLGSAMALKICSNLVSMCSVMVSLEAVSIAESGGVPVAILLDVMRANGILTPYAQYVIGARSEAASSTQAAMEAVGEVGEKDLRLAEALAAGANAEAPITSFVRARVKDEIDKMIKAAAPRSAD